MAGFLGTLEYVLEEGPQYEWLQDTSVAICAWICVVSAIAFFVRVFTAAEPIVNLRTFTNRNFAVGSTLQFCIGIGLYGLTYIYPRYLAEVRGYSALMIGETMFVSGITMFLVAPLVGRLMASLDMRYMIAFGLIVFAIGSYQMTWITRDFDFYELLIPQILRGVGMMFAMVPTNNIALGTLPPDKVKNASGLFNLMRNLGGAVGLAVINTVLNDRADLHITPPSGARDLGQRDRDRNPDHASAEVSGARRFHADGDEAAQPDRASPGRGDELWRRVLHSDLVLSEPQPPGHAAEQAGFAVRRRRRRALTVTHAVSSPGLMRDCASGPGSHHICPGVLDAPVKPGHDSSDRAAAPRTKMQHSCVNSRGARCKSQIDTSIKRTSFNRTGERFA